MVNQYCTCGAKLPEDARFCHKCGKPQWEPEPVEEVVSELAPEITPPPPLPLPEEAKEPPAINFRNVAAVRVGMLVSFIVAVLLSVPMPSLLQTLWQVIVLLAAGFLSVYLYHRRTGEYLNIRSGARMGWITGVFCFLIMLVMFTIGIAVVASGQGISQLFADALAARGTPEVADQLKDVLGSPLGMGLLIFGMVLASFMMAALLAMAGGALGAKVIEKE